ncbi:MAG TPA: hypothetical protein VGE52_11325 [Pirellulales bacterium]
MTEAEWLASADPWEMLAFLGNAGQSLHRRFLSPTALTRALGRFAIAGARRLEPSQLDPRSRRLIDVFEQFLDGRVPHAEVLIARAAAYQAADELARQRPQSASAVAYARAAHALPHTLGKQPFARARYVLDELRRAFARARGDAAQAALPGEISEASKRRSDEALADDLRDAIGNPFRRTAFDPAWRSPEAVRIAEAIRSSGDRALLPILADALEEAGCDDAETLAHCRGPGPHIRGCWAIEAILEVS